MKWLAGLTLLLTCATCRADYVFTTFDVPGATYTTLTGINNVGQVVGFANGPRPHAFIYKDGVYADLGGVFANGINDSGTVVGSYEVGGKVTGFSYSSGIYTTIDPPRLTGTALGSTATGINNRGLIVGWAGFGELYVGYTFDGRTTSLFRLGSTDNLLLGVNNKEALVGRTDNHGFYTVDGLFVFIGDYLPKGINDSGVVVGSYGFDGFVLTHNVPQIVDFPGAIDTMINGINNAGDLVGQYTAQDGSIHGFIAAAAPVPEPLSLSLVAIGAIGIWLGRKRIV